MTDEKAPPRVQPGIRSAPRIRQVYWCDFPPDAIIPEFGKRRPVLVISKKARLYGNVTVLPFTTKSQPGNPAAYSLESPFGGRRAWVICDYITTVSVARLSSGHHVPRLSQEDFNRIVALVLKHLPSVLAPDATRA